MITIPDLRTALLDLLYEVQDTDIKLIIGGGYGIYLKTEYVRRLGLRTLLREWPETRSTNDLDLYLRPELLIESEKLKPLAESIARLGYQVVPGAEKYQFVKPGPGGLEAGKVKIDILTGPQSRFQGTRVRTDTRRARPNPSVGIHAHPVDETPTLEEGLLAYRWMENSVQTSLGKLRLFLPHPYTFLMMKLFAFRDGSTMPKRNSDATMPWIYTRFWRPRPRKSGTMPSNCAINMETSLTLKRPGVWSPNIFLPSTHLGMVRLRESPYFRPELQLDEFMSALQELFPSATETNPEEN